MSPDTRTLTVMQGRLNWVLTSVEGLSYLLAYWGFGVKTPGPKANSTTIRVCVVSPFWGLQQCSLQVSTVKPPRKNTPLKALTMKPHSVFTWVLHSSFDWAIAQAPLGDDFSLVPVYTSKHPSSLSLLPQGMRNPPAIWPPNVLLGLLEGGKRLLGSTAVLWD